MAAHGRAVAVLASVAEVPGAAWIAERATPRPLREDARVEGIESTVVRPAGEGPWPAVVFVNGATPLGRHHPAVERLALALARVGHLVVVPDPPGLRRGEITTETLGATARVARAVSQRPDASGGRIALIGISTGASLALLVAADEGAARVSAVVGIAPYADLRSVVELATTGYHRDGASVTRHQTSPFLGVAVARSLAAALPPGRDRARLRAETLALDDRAPDPLAPLRALPRADFDRPAQAVLRLLANRDPARFDALSDALPPPMRTALRRLSPVAAAAELRLPVELAVVPDDPYFPPAEARRIERAAPPGRVRITRALPHGPPEFRLRTVPDLLQSHRFVVRGLRAVG